MTVLLVVMLPWMSTATLSAAWPSSASPLSWLRWMDTVFYHQRISQGSR
jgi:hypothetical protein